MYVECFTAAFANVPLNFSLINRNASFRAHIIYYVERHNSSHTHTKVGERESTGKEKNEELVSENEKVTTTGCDSHSFLCMRVLSFFGMSS